MLTAESANKPTSRENYYKLSIFLNIGFYGRNLVYVNRKKSLTPIAISAETVDLLDECFILFKKDLKRASWYRRDKGSDREQFEFEVLHFIGRLAHVDHFEETPEHEGMYQYFKAFHELEKKANKKLKTVSSCAA